MFLTAATPLRPTKKLRMSNIALDLLMRSADFGFDNEDIVVADEYFIELNQAELELLNKFLK